MTADDSTQPKSGKPAAGWGALKGTWRALVQEKTLVEGSKALLKLNQDDGFDCPGCAWPEPANKSQFEFCENGAKAVAADAQLALGHLAVDRVQHALHRGRVVHAERAAPRRAVVRRKGANDGTLPIRASPS